MLGKEISTVNNSFIVHRRAVYNKDPSMAYSEMAILITSGIKRVNGQLQPFHGRELLLNVARAWKRYHTDILTFVDCAFMSIRHLCASKRSGKDRDKNRVKLYPDPKDVAILAWRDHILIPRLQDLSGKLVFLLL